MTIKELKFLLKGLPENTVIDMSSDPEGNSFGDISFELGEATLNNGEKAYILYPDDNYDPEDRYRLYSTFIKQNMAGKVLNNE